VLTDAQQELISACTDLEQLETWGRRAAAAGSADELFN
jgi:hypothetical protein